MNILVCVKRVPQTGGRIVLTADGQAIDTKFLGHTISPHEECGVEEAVRVVDYDPATRRYHLPPEHAVEGSQELAVEYMTEHFPVTVDIVGPRPIFDPDNTRIRS